jgi:hypothetical protein
VQSVGKILNEAQVSLSTHKKCVKLMLARRHADPDSFLPEICNCILPVLLEYKVRRPPEGSEDETDARCHVVSSFSPREKGEPTTPRARLPPTASPPARPLP